MEVVDKTDGIQAEKVEDEVSFMLTNNAGGYCLLSHHPKSRFEGVFFRNGQGIFKVIDSFRHNQPITRLVNRLWTVSRERNEVVENFFMPLHSDKVLKKE